MPNPSSRWDKVPVYGFYFAGDETTPLTGRVELTLRRRVTRIDGRIIYAEGAKVTRTIGDHEAAPAVRDAVRAAWRAADEAALGEDFDGAAWDAWWNTMLTGAVFAEFPAGDDPDIVQVDDDNGEPGYAVRVDERLTNGEGRSYNIRPLLAQLDTTPPGINLGLIEVPPGSPTVPAPMYAKGVPGGVAGLDAEGRVLDGFGTPIADTTALQSQVDTIAGSYARRGATGRSDLGLGSAATQPATAFAPASLTDTVASGRPSAYLDATAKSNGALPATLDTGQTLLSFGGSPATISGGRIVHPQNSASNIAAYLQADIGSGVTEIGAVVEFPAVPAPGSFALVLPSASWVNGVSPPAGVHFVLDGLGAWHVSTWTGSAENPIYASGTVGEMNDGRPRKVVLLIDRAASTLTIMLPDGTVGTASHANITAQTGTRAIWELYELDNTMTPAKVRGMWANGTPTAAQDLGVTHRDVAQAAQAAARLQPMPKAVVWSPSAESRVAVPNAEADLSPGNTELTFVAPPSGKVLVELSAFLTMTGAGQVLWGVQAGAATLFMHTVTKVQTTGQVRTRRTVSVTPGQTYTLRWRHWSVQTGVATVEAHGGPGYDCVMSVQPVL